MLFFVVFFFFFAILLNLDLVYCENAVYWVHTGSSFNTGTENTMQVSKFKRIGFEKKMADFDGGE